MLILVCLVHLPILLKTCFVSPTLYILDEVLFAIVSHVSLAKDYGVGTDGVSIISEPDDFSITT